MSLLGNCKRAVGAGLAGGACGGDASRHSCCRRIRWFLSKRVLELRIRDCRSGLRRLAPVRASLSRHARARRQHDHCDAEKSIHVLPLLSEPTILLKLQAPVKLLPPGPSGGVARRVYLRLDNEVLLWKNPSANDW